MQTVIVTIAARAQVETFLGQLEGQGYLADRLELPILDQLRATPMEGDGVWIYPGQGSDRASCLIAWWYGGSCATSASSDSRLEIRASACSASISRKWHGRAKSRAG